MTRKRTLLGGGALERGHSASLEPLAQLGYALRGVGAFATRRIDVAELVAAQATKRKEECQWALTHMRALSERLRGGMRT